MLFIREITSKDARQSAIFWALGYFYDYSIYDLANLFRIPFGLFSQELQELGVSLEENDHELGYCRHCHSDIWPIWNESEFCSETCKNKHNMILSSLNKGLIPITRTTGILYNNNTNSILRIE